MVSMGADVGLLCASVATPMRLPCGVPVGLAEWSMSPSMVTLLRLRVALPVSCMQKMSAPMVC